ncbi:MAG: pyridoxal-phosphate dependent enzyme, partial [Endomicrobiia bacterium]
MFFLKCISCGKEFPHNEGDYICLECGENLDVVYDYNSIRKKFSPEDLKHNKNWNIWRYFHILPFLKSFDFYILPSLTIGGTPLHKAVNLEKNFGLRNLYLKDDTKTPSCSFKDRASAVVVVKGQEIKVKTY